MDSDQGSFPPGYVPYPTEDELPCEDGEPMETPEHLYQMGLLITALQHHWRDRTDVYVGGNMFVHYTDVNDPRARFRGPDFFAVNGDTVWRRRKSWVVWHEGPRFPDLVVELTSESTEAIDRQDKMRIYRYVWHVPDYVIFDLETLRLDVYRPGPGTQPYEPVAADARALYPLPSVALTLGLWEGRWQGIERTWLRLFTPEGALLPTPEEDQASRRAAAEAHAAAAEAHATASDARAAAAEARAAALEAELAALRPRPPARG